ncbi:MAG: glycosyltransferase [Selenomonadaceae bacterium]|nr:glycosyltransferase [Selenomonadaceae bacterium]
MPDFVIPKVSVIIPMYNAEKFIETCVNSVIGQTLKDFEIIIIDDCSTDQSYEIVSKKFASDPRVQVFQNPTRMHCDITRTLGITRARGEYVFFMDSDDALLPKTLEIFVKASDLSKAEVVIMNSCLTTADQFFKLPAQIKVEKRICADPTTRQFSDDIIKRFQHELIERGCHWEPWTRIQRRDFLLNNRISFPDTLRTGDLLFHLAEICCAKKVQVVNTCGYIWRQHPNQTIKLPAEEILKLGIQSFPAGLKYIRDLFNSKNLLTELSEEEKYNLELQAMIFYLTKSMNLTNLDVLQIKSIIQEMATKSEICTPEFVTSLFNIFLTQTVLINEQNKQLKELKSNETTESTTLTESTETTESIESATSTESTDTIESVETDESTPRIE